MLNPIVCCFVLLLQTVFAQEPSSEHRGVWVATVYNIDWPSRKGLSTYEQQEEMTKLLDTMVELKLNNIYFQVRPHGDALYASSIEPWSEYLTGVQGVPPVPTYDPLQFVIDEGHRRGIEVHAWFNPYRANTKPNTQGLAPNHMAIQYPQYAYQYGNYIWMDPGAQVVQDRTYDVIMDVIDRYDVDGVHMDDYFYPYPEDEEFPDDATYSDYLAGGGTMERDDWRRDNVNKLIERLYKGAHELRKDIVVSISPFGIYRPCHPEGQPCSIIGFDQYSGLYCDSKLWLQEGWVDILIPQLYWQIDPPAQSYPVLLDWWLSVNTKSRHVYAGNYLSRISLDPPWHVSELGRQVAISRLPEHRIRGSLGNVFFSMKMFLEDVAGVNEYFLNNVYTAHAQIPELPWLTGKQKNHNSAKN